MITALRGIDLYPGRKPISMRIQPPIQHGDRELQAVTHTLERKSRRQAGAGHRCCLPRFLTDDLRLYGRYAETVRMPSLFEDTVGFSSFLCPVYPVTVINRNVR